MIVGARAISRRKRTNQGINLLYQADGLTDERSERGGRIEGEGGESVHVYMYVNESNSYSRRCLR